MAKPITPALEPVAARRFVNQLQRLEGDALAALIGRAETWAAQADQRHADLTRRAHAGAHNLKRAVEAWDEVLPALHQAIQAATERQGTAPAEPVVDPEPTKPTERRAVAGAAATPGTPGAAAPSPALSGLDAAAQVLREVGEPMNAQDLVRRMLEQGIWTTAGKTPAATIYAAMIREVRAKGSASRFQKVDRGRFAAAAAG